MKAQEVPRDTPQGHDQAMAAVLDSTDCGLEAKWMGNVRPVLSFSTNAEPCEGSRGTFLLVNPLNDNETLTTIALLVAFTVPQTGCASKEGAILRLPSTHYCRRRGKGPEDINMPTGSFGKDSLRGSLQLHFQLFHWCRLTNR